MKNRKPYCSSNGCFMFECSSPSCPIKCPNCKFIYNGDLNKPTYKLCPKCHYCYLCNRIGKRFWIN